MSDYGHGDALAVVKWATDLVSRDAEPVTCPKCSGEGGYYIPAPWREYRWEDATEWDICPLCEGAETVTPEAAAAARAEWDRMCAAAPLTDAELADTRAYVSAALSHVRTCGMCGEPLDTGERGLCRSCVAGLVSEYEGGEGNG